MDIRPKPGLTWSMWHKACVQIEAFAKRENPTREFGFSLFVEGVKGCIGIGLVYEIRM